MIGPVTTLSLTARSVDSFEADLSALADHLAVFIGSPETPEHISKLLLGLVEIPEHLFRINVDDAAAAGASEVRLSLDLSDGARVLLAAFRAGNVDALIIEQAFGHRSSPLGAPTGDGESAGGAILPPTSVEAGR